MPTHKPPAERIGFLGDIHFPHQDDSALYVAEEYLKDFKPGYIYLIGDILDCYAISEHDRDPRRLLSFAEELTQAQTWLARLRRQHPKAKIFFKLGNHERRLQRYLWNRAPELSGVDALSWSNLLGLSGLDIELVEYNQDLTHHGFRVEHGHVVSSKSAYTAAKMLDSRGVSGISGHVHRMGSHHKKDASGLKSWYENGCLCRLDPEYIVGPPNWQQGFSVGFFTEDTMEMHIQQVPISPEHRIFQNGQRWTAKV